MTYKEFEQLLAEFNLHKFNTGSCSGFISPEYKWGDYPLIILLGDGKLKINMEFDKYHPEKYSVPKNLWNFIVNETPTPSHKKSY